MNVPMRVPVRFDFRPMAGSPIVHGCDFRQRREATVSEHDFTTLIDRSDQDSAKWQAMRRANPAVPAGIAPFSVADIDLPHPAALIQGLKAFLDDAVLGYTTASPHYIEAVIGWMRRRHDWQVDPAALVQSAGVVPAIHDAVRAFSESGAGVIVQTPAYHPFFQAIERNGRRLVRNPLIERDGHFHIDFEHLRRLAADPANRLLVFCSPHNPTGRVWSRAELEDLADIVLEHDLVVISDEIHFDLVLPGHRHTVLATLGEAMAARTITCTAPSKSFNLAGLCTSNLVIPDPALRARFLAQRDAGGFLFLTAPGYKACELVYNECEDWLDGLIELVARNHARVREFMAHHLPAVRVFELQGTYLQWMDFRGLGRSATELQRIHEQEALVFFSEGTSFGREGAGFERMNLATPSVVLEAALERLMRAYR